MAAIRKKYWTSLRITDRGMSQFRFKKHRKESLHMNMNTMKLILRTRPRSLLLAFAFVLADVAIPATTMAAAASAAPSTVKHGDAPDLVLYNGKISTVDVNDSTVDAIAIRDGKILATGGERSNTRLT